MTILVVTTTYPPADISGVGSLAQELVEGLANETRMRVLTRIKPEDSENVVATGGFSVGGFEIEAQLVCHPGPTVGYRISCDGATLCYMPDHEPALGARSFPDEPQWLSGFELAENADLLIHDAQFTGEEYPRYVGWGHSSIDHVLAFAKAAGARHLVPFHHDPSHSDDFLDRVYGEIQEKNELPFDLTAAVEGQSFQLGGGADEEKALSQVS